MTFQKWHLQRKYKINILSWSLKMTNFIICKLFMSHWTCGFHCHWKCFSHYTFSLALPKHVCLNNFKLNFLQNLVVFWNDAVSINFSSCVQNFPLFWRPLLRILLQVSLLRTLWFCGLNESSSLNLIELVAPAMRFLSPRNFSLQI